MIIIQTIFQIYFYLSLSFFYIYFRETARKSEKTASFVQENFSFFLVFIFLKKSKDSDNCDSKLLQNSWLNSLLIFHFSNKFIHLCSTINYQKMGERFPEYQSSWEGTDKMM